MLRTAKKLMPRWSRRPSSRGQSAGLANAQGWKSCLATLETEIDTVLLDCDGVLWNGDTIIPGTREALASFRASGKRLIFITNNATKSRKMAAEKFEKLGILGVAAEDIITSGYSAARYLRAQEFDRRGVGGISAMVVGGAGITDELELASIPTVAPEPEPELEPPYPTSVSAASFNAWEVDPRVGAVVVGMDTQLSYRRVAAAALALQNPDCLFIATNMDAADNVGSGERPRLMPGAGAAVGALVGCTGREPVNCGKGGQWILELLEVNNDEFCINNDEFCI